LQAGKEEAMKRSPELSSSKGGSPSIAGVGRRAGGWLTAKVPGLVPREWRHLKPPWDVKGKWVAVAGNSLCCGGQQ